MPTLIKSSTFDAWITKLADKKARAIILTRLDRAEVGNFGDCDTVGDGVSEMRIHYGPGYRIYFTRRGESIYVLLCGGDKGTQRRDIARAKELAREAQAP